MLNKRHQQILLRLIPVLTNLLLLLFATHALKSVHIAYHLTYISFLLALLIHHTISSPATSHSLATHVGILLRTVESLFKPPQTIPTYIMHGALSAALIMECALVVSHATDSVKPKTTQAEMISDPHFRHYMRHVYVALFVSNTIVIHTSPLLPWYVLLVVWLGLALVEHVKSDLMKTTMFLADPAVKCMSLITMDGHELVWPAIVVAYVAVCLALYLTNSWGLRCAIDAAYKDIEK